MNLKRIISRGIIIGLLFNNIGYSFANKTLDEIYETFNDTNISIPNILEEDNVDIEIEGNTLVNLANMNSSFEVRNNNHWYGDEYAITEVSNLKLNTNYTFFIYKELLSNHNENYNSFEIGVGNTIDYISDHPTIITTDNSSGANFRFKFNNEKKEILKIKVAFTDFKDYKYLMIRPIRRHSEPVPGEEANANIKILMLEGDSKGLTIPYFEGIQSVGESKNNNLEVNSLGENLFDVEYFKELVESNYNEGNYGYEVKENVNALWVQNNHSSLFCKSVLKNNYRYKHNTQYLIKSRIHGHADNIHSPLLVYVKYEDDTYDYAMCDYTSAEEWRRTSFITDKDKTVKAIEYSYGTNSTKVWFDLDSMYIGEYIENKTDFDYEYKQTTKNIPMLEPLRGISDSIRDRVVKINGEWYIERKCGEIKGSDIKKVTVSQDNELYTKFRLEDLAKVRINNGNSPILTNKFKIGAPAGWELKIQDEVVEPVFTLAPSESGYNNHRGMLYLTLSRDKATTADEAKEWINNSDLRIVYELAEPKFEKININLSLPLYKGTTHIYTDSNIPANIKVVIDRTINRATEAIELAKMNPTVENIALARMWTNLLKDSAIKDRLEDSISDITNIVDMTIEKKKVTANLDMYIKPENSISMSLSTNSITFDNYTGLEDMEKLGALDITINSSLPYSLNAYMPKELSNADGSSSMGVNLLNIRENTQSAYSQFVNTTDKVVLKSDCDKGNNKVHTIDLKLASDRSHKSDVYRAVIKFEAEQK